DTHAHYDDRQFESDFEQLIDEMRQNGVEKIITCGVTLEDSEKVLQMCEKCDILYAAVGVYPHETHKQPFDAEKLEQLAKHKKCVAIGEIGLDYFYDDSPRDTQIEVLKRQIEVANACQLPITFHDRDAHQDSLEILKKYKPKGVVHCYSGSVEMAKEIVKIGMSLGIGGVLTFKNARVLPDVVREIPLENLVLETDAPYMAPVPYRGKRNRSDYIIHIAEKIAEIKGNSVEEVLRVTNNNAKEIFKF
ncbi:MAG: TatD family hydrolase, partial [Clostridia bacterium]|nr:TatD family hydrolase [Clostridia bacterium]